MSGFDGGGTGSSGGGGGGGGGSTIITSPIGNHTKVESVAVTLSTNEPSITVDISNFPANVALETGGNLESIAQSIGPAATPGGMPNNIIAVGAYDSINDSMRNLFLTPNSNGLLVNIEIVGQKTMAASAPVVIASNQTAIPVTGTFFQATQPVSGTVTANLGTIAGASTSALQTTGNSSLSSIDGKIVAVNTGAVVISSGSLTANIGTTNGLALDTTLTTLSGKFASTTALADTTTNPTVTNIGIFNQVFNGTTWDRTRSGLLGAQSSGTGIQNTLSMGRYNASAPTLTDGQMINNQLDINGNQKIIEQFAPVAEDNANGVIAVQSKPTASATYSPTVYTNYGSAITQNIKATSGNVFSFAAQNLNAAARYMQFFNTATTPSAGAVPALAFPINPGLTTILNTFFSSAGINFTTGIAMGISTTSGTYTAATAAEHLTIITYK